MLTFILFVLAVCYLLVDIPLTLIDMYLTIRNDDKVFDRSGI